jgi:integrase/recombinase XerD
MRGHRRKGPRELPAAGDDPQGLAAHLVEYLDTLRAKNYSEGTVEAALAHLRGFQAWCAERGITRSAEVTRAILERYQRWLFHSRRPNGKPLSFRTQQYRLVSVRSFFKYLSRARHIAMSPAADLELPRLGLRLPREGLTTQEAEQVLAEPDVKRPLGLRDRAILETFYSTGMRRMELAGLLVYDIDEERGTVMIRQGKGKKDRVVPIGERALAWVVKYRDEVRPQLVVEPDPGVLFLNELGEGLGTAWLTIMVRSPLPARGGDADAGGRGGRALRPGDARPRQARHHPGLHPRVHPGAQGHSRCHPSGGTARAGRGGPRGCPAACVRA